MKINKITIALITIFFSCVLIQQVGATEASNRIHFSGKVHVRSIQAAKNSTLRLASMKLKSSSLGSSLKINNQVRIGAQVVLRKNAQVRMGSFNLDNAYIGGAVNVKSNVDVQKRIDAQESSDIGLGGVQISADQDYNPQTFKTILSSQDTAQINSNGNRMPGFIAANGGAVDGDGLPGAISSATNGKIVPAKKDRVIRGIGQSNVSGKQLQALSQRDPQWNTVKLGNTKMTLGDYGCLVTSLAMLKGTTPDKVNSALVKNNGFTSEGYLKHTVADATLGIGNGARKGKNWKPDYDTVAEVKLNGSQHFVVWRTDGTILDPWTGKAESQSKYPLVSFRDYHKG